MRVPRLEAEPVVAPRSALCAIRAGAHPRVCARASRSRALATSRGDVHNAAMQARAIDERERPDKVVARDTIVARPHGVA